MKNEAAAGIADLVIISVPVSGHRVTVESIKDVVRDKIVLDVSIPLAFKPLRYAPPPEGSNALEVQAILGKENRVTAGFHTISAELLLDLSNPISGDVLIAGDDKDAKASVIRLAESIGLRAFDAGSLILASSLEGLTPVLISINKRYNSTRTGIRLEVV